MHFREMDPQVLQQLLDATDEKGNRLHQDLITPLVLKEQAVFRNSPCPKCGGAQMEAFVDAARPFVPGNPLPHKNLRCLACLVEFDPYTRLILRAPTDE